MDITREKFTETGEASEPDLIVPVCPLYNVAACPQFTLGGNTGRFKCSDFKPPKQSGGNVGFLNSWRRVLEGLIRRRGCL